MTKILAYCFILLCSMHVLAGTRVIKGIVIAKGDGLPVSGAFVLEKGTENGVTANIDGEFEIKVTDKEDVILEFSFQSMGIRQVTILRNQDFYEISLEDVLSLEVTVDYTPDYPQRKRIGCGGDLLPRGTLLVDGVPDVSRTSEVPIKMKKKR
ncbi:carboxypeptidase-like regulatory domain-containing protein [Myroides odoratus]|uniref:carboxypeptidase-like regulatory domain-containing protein n=1 Tax=Myroides odoratus TaxID=256 RepID=UPI0009E79425|nr:carboxypeptidase-like regulatory domain-containing protein [Myroides odoratus]